MSDSGVSAVAQKSGFQSKYWTQPTRINHRETPKNEASSRFPSQHRLAPTISIFLHHYLCQLFSQRKTSKKFLVQHRDDTPGSMLLRIQLPSSLTSHHHGSGAMWPKTGEKAIALFRHGAKPGVYWILSRPSSHPGSFKCFFYNFYETGSDSLVATTGDYQQDPRIQLFFAWPASGQGKQSTTC